MHAILLDITQEKPNKCDVCVVKISSIRYHTGETRTKYLKNAVELLNKTSGAASARIGFQLKHNRAENLTGTPGGNLAKDLIMEQYNRSYKGNLVNGLYHTKLPPPAPPRSLRTLRNMRGVGVGINWRGVTVAFTTPLLLSNVANHTVKDPRLT